MIRLPALGGAYPKPIVSHSPLGSALGAIRELGSQGSHADEE
ncbi:hypothetical protein [Microvirga terricola]|nr:hypothetical protein [Microvirga terricola]